MRDEATAVFAADATARLTGMPGVAAVTAGPGLTNTLTALKNAQLAQSPVLLLGGAAPTALQGRGALQDIDQRPLVAPHVKLFSQVRRVRDLGPAVEEALRRRRAPACPARSSSSARSTCSTTRRSIRDWYADAAGKGTALADRALRWYLNRHVAAHVRRQRRGRTAAARARWPRRAPPTARVRARGRASRGRAAADGDRQPGAWCVLGAGRRAGRGGRADSACRCTCRAWRAACSGRDHPLQMRHQRRDALREADCVLLAGVPCDFRLDYGKHVRRCATLIAANRSAKDARLNRTPDIAAIGDAGLFLQALARPLPGTGRALGRLDRAQLRARDADARGRDRRSRPRRSGEHVNPLALLPRARARPPATTRIFVADGGDFVATASYVLHPRGPLTWLDPGAFGTLGVGAGFALGAALARPGAEVWIVWGDGACGYGLAEFDTFVRHGIPVIAVVGNDAGWTQIAREQVKMLDDDVGTVLARTAYHEVAHGFGAEGIAGPAARPRSRPALARARELGASGQAGAGQRLARQDRVPRGLDLDVAVQ